MPARWKMGLALLALLLAGQLRAGQPGPQDVIARCAARPGPVADGISALNKACPGVEDALAQLQLTALMPAGWRKTLTAHGLADVDTLRQRYSASRPSQPPRAAALRSIAAALAPRQAPLTWVGRIRAWISRSLLQPVGRWLRSLGPELRSVRHPQAIFYGLIALLLTAVVAVLAFELRGSRLLRSIGRTTLQPRRRRGAAGTKAARAHASDPDWALLRGQPARLLRLLVATLTRARRLEGERHLTCRELETQARFETEIERSGFTQVARLAERELYGPPGVTALSEETLRDAQTLHARLVAAVAQDGDLAQ
jgi:hypothetical protein